MQSNKKLLKLTFLSMMVALGVIISPILRVEGMAPMAHFINITCAVFLGPYYALLCAFTIGIIRMAFMGIPPLALTGAIFGAFLSGVFYRVSKGRMIFAVIGEIIGTGFIGSIISYPVMAFIMNRGEVTLFFYVPSFISGTLIGGTIAFIFLKYLNKSGLIVKLQQNLGSKTIEKKENPKADSIGIVFIGIAVFIAVYLLMKVLLKITGFLTLSIPSLSFLLVLIFAGIYYRESTK